MTIIIYLIKLIQIIFLYLIRNNFRCSGVSRCLGTWKLRFGKKKKLFKNDKEDYCDLFGQINSN